MKDSFKTIDTPSIGNYKEKGSKFIAYAFPVNTLQSIQSLLEQVRKEHPKARHHCYAYRLGVEAKNYRANDDGEPSGTAGKPILGQLKSFEVTNTLVVVVRYFGGTLLGASGLIRAYKSATLDALEQTRIVKRIVMDVYALCFDYAIMSNVMNAIKKQKLEIIHQQFDNSGIVHIGIRQNEVGQTLLDLKAAIAKIPVNMVKDLKAIEGLEIKFLETR